MIPVAEPADPEMTREALLEDLEILERAVETSHAAIGWVVTREAVHQRMEAAKRDIEPMGVRAFGGEVADVLSVLRCGHTDVGLPEALEPDPERPVFFPLPLLVVGDRVLLGAGAAGLPRGTEILSLQGRPALEILSELRRHRYSDVDAGPLADRLIEEDFAWEYALWFDRPESFTVEVQEPGAATPRAVELAAVPFEVTEDLPSFLRADERGQPRGTLDFVWNPDAGLAIWTLSSFSDPPASFRRELRSDFARLAADGIDKLVLDLRWNGGGREGNEELLLSFLTDEPFPKYESVQIRTYDLDYLDHTPWAGHEAAIARRLRAEFPLRDGDVFAREASPRFSRPRRTEAFPGRVVVLVGGGTFSGGAEFAALARRSGRVTMVGEETGGGFCGNTSGWFTELTLPNSGLEVRIPLFRFVFSAAGPGCQDGVIPDETVPVTVEDVVAGRDAAMRRALELVRR